MLRNVALTHAIDIFEFHKIEQIKSLSVHDKYMNSKF